jgi:hypothetical protein
MTFLTRTDPARKIDRHYVVDITPMLFGEFALLREWGRRGWPGVSALGSKKTGSPGPGMVGAHGLARTSNPPVLNPPVLNPPVLTSLRERPRRPPGHLCRDL